MDFLKAFFPSTIIERNNLYFYLHNMLSISALKQNILKFTHLGTNKVYNDHNPSGLKIFNRGRLGLTHLRAHKFSHNISDCLDELCICITNIESNSDEGNL